VRPTSRFLTRHWLTLTALVGVGVLAVAQAIWFRVTKPTLPDLALVAVGGLAVLGVFLLLLICVALQVRRPLRDLRYRWLTRDIDRQMRATRASTPRRFHRTARTATR
jgi:hypothetical protein